MSEVSQAALQATASLESEALDQAGDSLPGLWCDHGGDFTERGRVGLDFCV